MATVAIPPGGIALHGSPDSLISMKEEMGGAVQVMPIQMTQDVIDELLKSVRSGKPPQILFGKTPTLRYAGKKHVLDTTPEPFRHELYYNDGDNGLAFKGLVNYSLAFKEADRATNRVDLKLEALNATMAAIAEEREARRNLSAVNSPNLSSSAKRPTANSHRQDLFKKAGFLSPLARSQPTTPSRLTHSSPSLNPAPTSAPAMHIQPNATLAAVRYPLIHLLAVQPRKTRDLIKLVRGTEENIRIVLERCARHEDDGTWELENKGYRDLDVWKFPYLTQLERQSAINRAIKALDRLRLGPEDKTWQLLLPVKERGKGKCLSRLVIRPTPMSTTPIVTAKQMERKEAARKAKANLAESEKSKERLQEKKTATDSEKKLKTKPLMKEKKDESQQRKLKQQELKGQIKKPSEAELDTASLKKAPKQAPAKPSSRPSDPAKKVLNTKPKNQSPLSASPPVNASDFESDHPVHKTLSASASPAKPSTINSDKALKRKANDIDNDIHKHDVSVKRRQLDGTTPSSSQRPTAAPSASAPPKRKAAAADLDADASKPATPAKVRKLTSAAEQRPPASSSLAQKPRGRSPESDSSDSPTLQLSFRQTIELAQKFRNYHEKYEALYRQIASSERPPSEAKREELMMMHRKLEEMKREIRAGAGRK